jgi:phage/plasmid-like protein (TIGR03299 family)
MDFFSKFVKAGHMKMETAGSLWEGRYIWGLARIGKDFSIGKADEVRGYVLLCSPHVLGKAMLLQCTPIRVVCWNTLCMALGSSLKGKGNAFRMPHTTEFSDAVKADAELALKLVTEQMVEFKDAATLLSKKKIDDKAAEVFFCDVLQFDPKKAAKKKNEEIKVPRMLPKFQEALQTAPGAQLAGSAGTLWGALNAVTFVCDHDGGRGERSTELKNAWLGHKSNIKRRALKVALEHAK